LFAGGNSSRSSELLVGGDGSIANEVASRSKEPMYRPTQPQRHFQQTGMSQEPTYVATPSTTSRGLTQQQHLSSHAHMGTSYMETPSTSSQGLTQQQHSSSHAPMGTRYIETPSTSSQGYVQPPG